jgi:hypothetical protein
MKFIHYQTKSGFGGITIGYTQFNEKLMISIAQCSNRDRYCKKIGRDIVIKKYIDNNRLTLSIKGKGKTGHKRIEDTLYIIAEALPNLRGIPSI